ncbi:MAG: hypothetical protein Q8K63_09045 [Acidimicrobiales bacterium]|nr:hypothetical protein [Acidimicrobiales bacterium]
MTTSMHRARPFYLAASAAVVLATSFGAGRVLTIENASDKTAFEENPVAGVTVPTLPDEVAAPVATTTTALSAVSPSAPTTGAPAATTPTTAASALDVVCQWTAKIVAGGIPGPLPYGDADQFLVTITNPAWAGQPVTIDRTFQVPAGRRPVSLNPPTTIVADATGTATFAIPIGPESQGGAISVLVQPLATDLVGDLCDTEFPVDYNGPQGLVGGILASAATNLLNLNLL